MRLQLILLLYLDIIDILNNKIYVRYFHYYWFEKLGSLCSVSRF